MGSSWQGVTTHKFPCVSETYPTTLSSNKDVSNCGAIGVITLKAFPVTLLPSYSHDFTDIVWFAAILALLNPAWTFPQ